MKINKFCNNFYRPKKTILQDFDALSFLKIKNTKNQPPKYNRLQPPTTTESNDSEIEMDDLQNQLSAILLEDEKNLLNKTGRMPNIRFQITSARDKHTTDDVFIARANNPFGHSTKWRYK